jgi:hypothetical protein
MYNKKERLMKIIICLLAFLYVCETKAHVEFYGAFKGEGLSFVEVKTKTPAQKAAAKQKKLLKKHRKKRIKLAKNLRKNKKKAAKLTESIEKQAEREYSMQEKTEVNKKNSQILNSVKDIHEQDYKQVAGSDASRVLNKQVDKIQDASYVRALDEKILRDRFRQIRMMKKRKQLLNKRLGNLRKARGVLYPDPQRALNKQDYNRASNRDDVANYLKKMTGDDSINKDNVTEKLDKLFTENNNDLRETDSEINKAEQGLVDEDKLVLGGRDNLSRKNRFKKSFRDKSLKARMGLINKTNQAVDFSAGALTKVVGRKAKEYNAEPEAEEGGKLDKAKGFVNNVQGDFASGMDTLEDSDSFLGRTYQAVQGVATATIPNTKAAEGGIAIANIGVAGAYAVGKNVVVPVTDKALQKGSDKISKRRDRDQLDMNRARENVEDKDSDIAKAVKVLNNEERIKKRGNESDYVWERSARSLRNKLNKKSNELVQKANNNRGSVRYAVPVR